MEVDVKNPSPMTGPSANTADLRDDSRNDSGCNQFGHHTGVPEGSSSRSKDFEFVLVTDNQSRRQVRRHAMRQHMRQRRLDGIARLEAPRTPIGGWVMRDPPNPRLPHSFVKAETVQGDFPTNADAVVKDEEQAAVAARRASLPLIPLPDKVKRDDSVPPAVLGCLADPRPSPGLSGNCDPFDSYPIVIRPEDHELIDHFVATYPSMMYKIEGSIPSNPMAEIFRQFALHDRLPFQAMLAIASKHRAGAEGKTESVQSLTHKMRALRLMNECFQGDPKSQHDGSIYAVATMAVIEKWSKDVSIEQIHFNGLLPMIRSRGGMRGMRLSSPFLEKVLYWVDFSCASNAVMGTSLPWTGAVPDIPPKACRFLSSVQFVHSRSPKAIDKRGDPNDHFRACETFLAFFRRLNELEDIALASSEDVPSGNTPVRTRRFAPGALLYSILTMLPDYNHGIRDVRFIDEYTCMACLLFLNVTLYDCYLKSSNFDQYLDWLDMEVNQLNAQTNPSITSVLWLFLNNGGYPNGETTDSGERCWFVSRLLRVAKRLEWKRHGTVWDRLRAALIESILTQQECALGSDCPGEEALLARQQKRQNKKSLWDEEEMRNDILEASTSDARSL